MQFGKLSIVCISLYTYVGCKSETVSETCIDCSRVMESACDCKEKNVFTPTEQCNSDFI